jgi:hypothetical protein
LVKEGMALVLLGLLRAFAKLVPGGARIPEAVSTGLMFVQKQVSLVLSKVFNVLVPVSGAVGVPSQDFLLPPVPLGRGKSLRVDAQGQAKVGSQRVLTLLSKQPKSMAYKLAQKLEKTGKTLEWEAAQVRRIAPPWRPAAAPAPPPRPGQSKEAQQLIQKATQDFQTGLQEERDLAKQLTCVLRLMCFAAGTLSDEQEGQGPLEGLTPGRRVAQPRRGLPAPTRLEVEPAHWRLVRLWLDYGSADGVEAALLRPADWLPSQGAALGQRLWLELPHVGVRGWAQVTAVEPCPKIEAGSGRLVTGTFRRLRAWCYDLAVEGEPVPLGVTGRHPFWSADRKTWIQVEELRIGERLEGRDGRMPRVLSRTLRAQPEPVYNIEVDGEHCYRVGQQGLLVHNQSVPARPAPAPATPTTATACDCAARLAQYRSQGLTPAQIVRMEGISNTTHYLWWLACKIAHAAGVRPQSGSTPVVAVALVCEEGSNTFKIYVSYNLRRGADAVRAATEVELGPGHWIGSNAGTHAEQNIVNYFQSAQHRGDIAGVAASRCICPSCVSATGSQLASPRGRRAVPTCNVDGTPAIPQARQWCQNRSSPIPYDQQF